MHIMRLFLLTLCSSAMCREIAVPCSMRRHYKDCISNDSCSWCCDSAVPGEVCRCEETSVREKRYAPPECAEAGYTGVDLCSPHNSSTEDCSGRGVCVCGKCECEIRENPKEAFFGTFCECDNFSCDRWNGVLCGGPERGVCICGECSCLATWGGTACSCSLSNETCIAPGSNSLEHCSGRGTCDCGQCTCEETFVGIFCEEKMV